MFYRDLFQVFGALTRCIRKKKELPSFVSNMGSKLQNKFLSKFIVGYLIILNFKPCMGI